MGSAGERWSNKAPFPDSVSDAPIIKRVDIIRKNTPVINAPREYDSNILLFLNTDIHILIEIRIHIKNTKIKYKNITILS
jgi:hypothetical protein